MMGINDKKRTPNRPKGRKRLKVIKKLILLALIIALLLILVNVAR